jgi:hypothetical protein
MTGTPSTITFRGLTYRIESRREVPTVGDADLRRRIAYVDRGIRPEYRQGIALHELVEREGLRQGLTNAAAHARANLAEYRHYARTMGEREAAAFMHEEEIASCLHARPPRGIFPPYERPAGFLDYKGVRWRLVEGFEERTGIDILPRRRILRVNRRVPPDYRPAIGVYVIEERGGSERGIRYSEADRLAWRAVRAWARQNDFPERRVREMKRWQGEFYQWGLLRHKRKMLRASHARALEIITTEAGRGWSP